MFHAALPLIDGKNVNNVFFDLPQIQVPEIPELTEHEISSFLTVVVHLQLNECLKH